MSALVEINELRKVYRTGDVDFQALRGISLKVSAGEFIAIMGASGSGKSTMLHMVGGLDTPTSGTVTVAENALHALGETEMARFRRRHVGFIFQFFNLVDNLTVQMNVELPALLMRGQDRRSIRRTATELLDRLGIAEQAPKHPWELSGGQQQRVAIARALINSPTVLLADEPTGNLDSTSSQEVLTILKDFNRQGQTILMVTHDAVAAAGARRILLLHDGSIVDSMDGGDATQVALRLTHLA